MIEKYLIIVEGMKTEKNIFGKIFQSYGFNVVDCLDKVSTEYELSYDEEKLEKDNKNIILIQGPRTRIHDILVNITANPEDDINNIDVEAIFGYKANDFRGVFWIYDVDHNSNSDIKKMFSKFNDENENGLLLLSSPCIEVLGEFDHNRHLVTNQLKRYKSILNDYHSRNGYNNTEDYIIDNINELLLYYLNKNYEDFKDSNIMNHPEEIIDFINVNNIRDNINDFVDYRYFSTVVYCVLAFVLNLTEKIDNYSIVKEYLEKNI